jgi:O-antigen/teichoic acid export membrane protein
VRRRGMGKQTPVKGDKQPYMKKRSELRASGIYLVGNIATKALAFLTIPIFTRILSTYEYGIVNTFSSWVSIASVVMELSLFNSFKVAFVDMHDEFEDYCTSVIRLSFWLFLGGMALATGAIALIPSFRSIGWLIYCCLIQAYGTVSVTTMSTKYMMQFNYRKRAIYMLVPNIASVALAIAAILMMKSDRYIGRIVAYVAVYAVFTIISLLTTRGRTTNTQYWRYAIRYSVPLVFHGLSLVVLDSSDRIMISSIINPTAAGVYSLVYNFSMIATAVTTAFEGIWIPWFAKKLKDVKIGDINQKAMLLIENTTVLVIGIILIAPEVLKLMSTREYWDGIVMIVPIVIASYLRFLYDLAVNVEYQYKATKQIMLNTVLAALLNIVLNFIFIPRYGAVAAAYTTVAAYLASFIAHMVCAKKYCKGIFPLKTYLPYLITVVASSVAVSLLQDAAMVRWGIAFALGVAYLYLAVGQKRFFAFSLKIEESPNT